MPRLYAHRGAAAEFPENTLPSFARALDLGADAIELDVHATADNIFVVAHDPTTARTAGVPAVIAKSSHTELRRLNVGHGFVSPTGDRVHAGQRFTIPTLDEVLSEFPNTLLNIDVKPKRLAIVRPLIELIRRHNAEHRVLLATFHLATMLRIRTLRYPGPTAMSRAEVAALLVTPAAIFRHRPLPGQAAQLPCQVAGLPLATTKLIDKCHRVGLRVDYWTINDAVQAETLLALGADGIMTDDPARIAPVFAKFRSEPSAAPAARPTN